MRVKKMNKIMVIQWDGERVRADIGFQEIEVRELIRILLQLAEDYRREYGL